MREASTADQHVRGVGMVQRRQDFEVCQQRGVVVTVAQPEAVNLLRQAHTGIDGGQRQLTHAARGVHFAQCVALHHADTTLTVTQFELN